MTHVYRCTHQSCRKRVILRKLLSQYLRTPKCPACGEVLTGSEDKAVKRQRKRLKCLCDGWSFPHRRGSKWCRHSTKPLTEADHAQRSTF